MPRFRRIASVLCVAPLALALAACGSSEEGGITASEPLDPIAAPAGTSWVETAAETPEQGMRQGNPDAPLKLVEYASHTCHVCADFSKDAYAELDEYIAKGIVSYEIRNLVRDPIDLSYTLLARCGPPAAFHALAHQGWEDFDGLMQSIQARGAALDAAAQQPPETRFQALGEASGLIDFFAARGVSRDQAMTCLADTAKAQRIAEASQKQGDELAITGTPTFFLNGERIEGTNWISVEAALQKAGAR
ncbi:MAG TPA: thioredoxin domain-containing protein [Croceibacterium sp.]|nr:thioredoxin domain-containing protein [Croceibacterium sp.]